MPVTAKLSRQFYDKFGDEVVNELVNWLNAVDTSYRTEFRELFEAHFGRLSAQMDRLVVELRGEFRLVLEREVGGVRVEMHGMRETLARHDVRFDAIETRLATFEPRFDAIESRLATFEPRFDTIEARLATFEPRFGTFEARFDTIEARVGHAVARVENRLMKWMITFFVATAIQLALLSAALWRVW